MAGWTDLIQQGKAFWATRNSRQKAFLIAGTVATLAIVSVFVRMIGTPEYKPLFTGLEAADAQTLSAQLDAEGIAHQTSSDGKTISVPADKLDAARLKTASQGSPHSGRMGFELFDKLSWGQTEFDQKVTYQRALEGELARTIETLGNVESARVHLVMPTDSVFLDKQQPAKASVILKVHGKGLRKDAILAISRLVAGAVSDLQPDDVSIIDADSSRSLSLHAEGGDDGDGLDNTLTQRLVSTLEPVVGVGKIKASVNVEHDKRSSDESQEKYDPAVSAVLSVQRTEDQAGGSAVPAGVPGTTSNVPTAAKPALPAAAQGNSQSSKTETAQYGVNRTVIRTVTPAGQIDHVTAAILIDDDTVKTVQGSKVTYTKRKRSPEELAKIRLIAAAVIGFDTQRGDTLSVENMAFDAGLSETDLTPPTWNEKLQKAVMDYSSVVKPVSLLVLFILAYFFMLRPIQKHALTPAPVPGVAQPALASAGPTANRLTAGDAEVESLRRAAQLKDQAAELIRQKPANTARALQAWLREEQA